MQLAQVYQRANIIIVFGRNFITFSLSQVIWDSLNVQTLKYALDLIFSRLCYGYGSKVTAFLLNWWILPIGGASSGRVCACSLRSRLVLKPQSF